MYKYRVFALYFLPTVITPNFVEIDLNLSSPISDESIDDVESIVKEHICKTVSRSVFNISIVSWSLYYNNQEESNNV